MSAVGREGALGRRVRQAGQLLTVRCAMHERSFGVMPTPAAQLRNFVDRPG
jgi:hypothetical protein